MPTWLIIVLAVPVGLYLLFWLLVALTARRSDAGIITSRFGRLLRIWGGIGRSMRRYLSRKLHRLFMSKARRAEADARYHEETAKSALATMGNMKGALMKLGQIVSFMDDTMPAAYKEHLSKLQSQAPPMDYDVVVRVIHEELGKDPERVFARFDEEPIAAASIGQVHRALTRKGDEVVVKIQYPGVDDAIAGDIKNTGMLMMMAGAVTPTMDARPLVTELQDRLLEELDYVREAANQQLFRDLYAGHETIVVPAVYPELSSHRVLTTEFIAGQGFYDFQRTASADARRSAVLTLREFVFDSLYLHHVFNGDPHPGNYLFMDDGRVAFLDFGCIRRFDPTFITDFKHLIRCYLDGDRDAVFDQCVSMNFIKADHAKKVDRDWLWDFSEPYYRPLLVDEPFLFTSEYCKEAITQMFGDNMRKLNMPPEYLLLNRITFGLNSIMAKLEAHENWRRLSLRYFYSEEEIAAMS
jgi:predicted unusual protein kinase regulating ubiquinone biosynthesis (AarF/ABC1/UbiB family)